MPDSGTRDEGHDKGYTVTPIQSVDALATTIKFDHEIMPLSLYFTYFKVLMFIVSPKTL